MEKKKDKKSTNQNKMPANVKSFLYIGCVVVAILLLAFGISLYQNSLRINNYQNVLEGVYRSSYFNMVDKVNNVSIDTDKLTNEKDKDMQMQTLRSISKDCDSIVASLSLLSINSANVIDLTKFFNQLGGLADAYCDKLYNGESLTDSDIKQIVKVNESLQKLKNKINPHNEGMIMGEYDFSSNSIMKDGKSPFANSLGNLTADEIEYPAMIFDGPFSTALETKKVKGLAGEKIDKATAQKIVQDKVFAGKKVTIKSTSETNADLDSWDFNVIVDDQKYFAQISKQGGMLLTLSGEAISSEPMIDENEAKQVAEKYATELGFENMKTVWVDTYQNTSYINLAPVVDDCILYPDLVKVKVDLTSKRVIGWDAQNYAFNHTSRSTTPALDEAEVLANLESENVMASSLAIIPMDDGIEMLAYEFVSIRDDGTYYIYYSADNGAMIKIMKEITTDKVHKLI